MSWSASYRHCSPNGEVGADQVEAAISRYGIDAETIDPYLV